jgi:hypothetical protein
VLRCVMHEFAFAQAVRDRIMQLPSRAATTQEIERVNEEQLAADIESSKLSQAYEVGFPLTLCRGGRVHEWTGFLYSCLC